MPIRCAVLDIGKPPLEDTRERGRRADWDVGGITGNQTARVAELLRTMELSADAIATSGEWGIVKPDPAFFSGASFSGASNSPQANLRRSSTSVITATTTSSPLTLRACAPPSSDAALGGTCEPKPHRAGHHGLGDQLPCSTPRAGRPLSLMSYSKSDRLCECVPEPCVSHQQHLSWQRYPLYASFWVKPQTPSSEEKPPQWTFWPLLRWSVRW
ncbi:hypothetical protein GCM10022402_44640 [Salinactinospora qingdaonensis]|uniref:Uncharacterized protein n=1 Tax=Salinactinospora qingdaonensis TaxID=702744 RepID=A0ABP7GEW6_9ACTN